MHITVKIFSDDIDPITCVRDHQDEDKVCPMLMSTRFGTAEVCRLFTESFGGKYQKHLERYSASESERFGWPYDTHFGGWLKPHAKCIEARCENIHLTNNEIAALFFLYDNIEDDGFLDNEWVAGHEVATYNRLIKKGLVKRYKENAGFCTTLLGREYVKWSRDNKWNAK